MGRPGGLWRHRDFRNLWAAETISQFGSQIDDLALGLVAIIVLDASAFEVAVYGTLNFLPFILFTLPAGVWVDRLPRRPILVIGDLGRFAILLTIPIAYVADALTLWQLYAVAFLTGVFTVFFDVAYQSYLPSLVDRDDLREGNSKLEISRSTAQLGGPGVGGVLVELITAPYAVLVDAFSFFASGLFLLRIRKREGRPAAAPTTDAKRSLWVELKEGLRFVLGNPNLRAQAGCTATSNLFFSVTFSIYLVFLVREVGLSPGVIGFLLAVGSVGSMIAAFTTTRISTRFGIGPDDDSRDISEPAGDALDRARSGQLSDPVHRGRRHPARLRDRRLQHHAGELPPGHLPAAPAGAHELRDAVPGLGDDPNRHAPGRCAGLDHWASRDPDRRCSRERLLVLVDRLLASAPPARDARADR